MKRSIGGIGNYYGGLDINEVEGRYYWSIEDYDGSRWEEIPEYLYISLNKFEDEKLTDKGDV